MSEHGLTFICDGFELNLTLKNTANDDWADAEYWGRIVNAVMDQVRSPLVAVVDPAELEFGPRR